MTQQSVNVASRFDVTVHLTIHDHGQFVAAAQTLRDTVLLRTLLSELTARARAETYTLIISWPGVTATDLGPIMCSLLDLQDLAQSSASTSSLECRETVDPLRSPSTTT